jgi:hypothetical protein
MFIYTSDRFKWDAKRLTLFLSVDFFGVHSSYVLQSRREKRDNNGWRIHAESRNAPSTCQAGAVGALSLSLPDRIRSIVRAEITRYALEHTLIQ